LRSNFGSLAMFAAIRRASSLLSNLAAERRPGSLSIIDVAQRLTVCVVHDETVRHYFGGPGRREAARRHQAADLSWISPCRATRTASVDLFEPERYLLIFIASSLAILPLAKWMGDATEQLAASFGQGVGGRP
jgi:hypothetical protein